jgi:hypothetical protein
MAPILCPANCQSPAQALEEDAAAGFEAKIPAFHKAC